MASFITNTAVEPKGSGKKRPRGDSLFFSDISNVTLPSKRASCHAAGKKMKDLEKTSAPRGRHVSMSPPPASTPTESTPAPTTECTPAALNTLRNLVRNHTHIITEGMHTLQTCTERNTIFSIQKATTLQVFGACVCNGMGIVESCRIAASSMGFSSEVVRRWAKEIYADFFATLSSLEDITDKLLLQELDSDRGKHPKWISLISDENVQAAVKSFIHDNGYVKGRPNLTLMDVVSWVRTTYDVEVSKSSVGQWLHQLGFTYVQHTKGVYFDGHERTDVVARRKAYLDTVQAYDKVTWCYNSPCPDPAIQPIIRVYHDESTYYANADQSFHWTDGTKQVLKKKSLGQSIMVSDFVEEVGGMLEHGDDKATLQLETHTDGYFTNVMLISQVCNSTHGCSSRRMVVSHVITVLGANHSSVGSIQIIHFFMSTHVITYI